MSDVTEMTTPDLVRSFAALKVWFAVNEVTGPTTAGNAKHAELGRVVNELRRRNVLDLR